MKMKTNIPKELAAMEKMTAGQLREKHRELFGEDSRSGNRQWLAKADQDIRASEALMTTATPARHWIGRVCEGCAK